MFELIERLRQKPDREKKKIAFMIAGSVSLIILIIWLSVIFPTFTKEPRVENQAFVSEPISGEKLTDFFKKSFSGVKSALYDAKETITSFSTTPEYYISTTTEG